VTVGYKPNGKRITRKVSDPTKTGAKENLKALVREIDDDEAVVGKRYTVANAVTERLEFGLPGRSKDTLEKLRILADTHVIPSLGARDLQNSASNRKILTADDVDRWLAEKAKVLATRTLQDLLSILRRSIHRAQAREKVKRNVALLCECPVGQVGATVEIADS
jgi:hypothetical protein